MSNAAGLDIESDLERRVGGREQGSVHRPSLFSLAPLPVPHITIQHPSASYFSSGWPVAYLAATAIFGIALTIGSMMRVSQPASPAEQRPSVATAPASSEIGSPLVGRITLMLDCRWSDPNAEAILGAFVPQGRRYALASGLMEITYDTGAKVIVQGPATYEVESAAGGYLSIGKLTAKLEKRSAVSGQRSETPNPQSLIPNPLFAVRTPTALVTDLGTEFGVEVDRSGSTSAHVFRGTIELQVTSDDGKPERLAQVLHENQSARVGSGAERRIKLLDSSAKPANFVRSIPKQTIKTLDLVDVVAGGDGHSGRRNRGIDPTTGRIANARPNTPYPYFTGDNKYHRVDELPFVDGVFIPDGSKGPVQVDSAGHTFEGFSKTDNVSVGFFWTGAYAEFVNSSTLAGIDYASAGHGVLIMHASKGITFDLEAIRQANPGCRLLRFRAMAGNTETGSASGQGSAVYADIWVLVDGQRRHGARQINGANGALPMTVPIKENDRFLTLVASDGGNSFISDETIFGDPRIEMLVAEPRREPDSQTK